jgi:hypothetical protein
MRIEICCSLLAVLLSCGGSGSDTKPVPATISFTENEYKFSSTDQNPRPIQLKLNLGTEEDKGWGGATIALGSPHPPVSISSNANPYLVFYANDSHTGTAKTIATVNQNQDGTLVKGTGKLTASMPIGPEMRVITAETTVTVE